MKKFIRNILVSRFAGHCICLLYANRFPNIRYRGYRFSLKDHPDKNVIAGWIFWGFYESAEIRMAERYFTGRNDVIELGTSSGILASHLIRKMEPGNRYYAVEANSRLREVWNRNIALNNSNGIECQLLNNIVGKEDKLTSFSLQSNTTESNLFNDSGQGESVEIECLRLSTLVDRLGIESFSLVSDIEGAEILYLFYDDSALLRCREIIIELHEVDIEKKHWTISEVRDRILGLGFTLEASDGPVFYFKRHA